MTDDRPVARSERRRQALRRGRALRYASLAVRPGEVHALMGANGAGKSTLVKILTGAVQPDAGTIHVRGERYHARSPGRSTRGRHRVASTRSRRSSRTWTSARNLRLTQTPGRAVPPLARASSGSPDLDLRRPGPGPAARHAAHHRPRPRARDRARVLMLDEMTAALPADLTERVSRSSAASGARTGRVIFISHRMIEIAGVCDRATVLREGETVGVVDVNEGSEERIVALMLGEIGRSAATAAEARPAGRGRAAGRRAPPRARRPQPARPARSSATSRSTCYAGEVLGVVALEGQGQDELFDILAGSRPPGGGELLVDGAPVSFRHPPTRSGPASSTCRPTAPRRCSCSGPCARTSRCRSRRASARWGPIDDGGRAARASTRRSTLQIDTRAASEVRRLSGGNQQKVTIARWVAGGVRTMLCFDPTRGIDIGTKRQIYELLRELAAAGAAVLLYTSELKEIQLACDRAIVIFGGRVVAEMPAADADEATLLRAAYDLPPDAPMPEDVARRASSAEAPACMPAAPPPAPETMTRSRDRCRAARSTRAAERRATIALVRRNTWTLGLVGLLVVFLSLPADPADYGAPGIQGLAISALPIALPRSPRRSSSSPAASTCRSAR